MKLTKRSKIVDLNGTKYIHLPREWVEAFKVKEVIIEYSDSKELVVKAFRCEQ